MGAVLDKDRDFQTCLPRPPKGGVAFVQDGVPFDADGNETSWPKPPDPLDVPPPERLPNQQPKYDAAALKVAHTNRLKKLIRDHGGRWRSRRQAVDFLAKL